MTDSSSTGIGESIRKGIGKIHGTGEAIRGNFNAVIDDIAGDQAGVVHNKEIAQKGVQEWDQGYQGHHQTGAEPATSNAANRIAAGSTNNGPHATNTENKLDPRVDSDMDHRAHPASSVATAPGFTADSSRR